MLLTKTETETSTSKSWYYQFLHAVGDQQLSVSLVSLFTYVGVDVVFVFNLCSFVTRKPSLFYVYNF